LCSLNQSARVLLLTCVWVCHSTIVNEKAEAVEQHPCGNTPRPTQEGGSLSTQSLTWVLFLLALSVALSILVTAIQVSEAHAQDMSAELEQGLVEWDWDAMVNNPCYDVLSNGADEYWVEYIGCPSEAAEGSVSEQSYRPIT
jgi:hypothetical protein